MAENRSQAVGSRGKSCSNCYQTLNPNKNPNFLTNYNCWDKLCCNGASPARFALGTSFVAGTGLLERQTPLPDLDCACSLKHVKMATMTRQQSTLLQEEQAGDYLPRRGSDQNLVCTLHQ